MAAFQDGFSFEAARAVLGDPHPLSTLKKWGLVSLKAGRYEVDPLLLPTVEVDESVQAAHFRYYRELAEQYTQRQDYRSLSKELSNLETAFKWALQTDHVEEAFALANTCSSFLAHWGRFEQRRMWFEQILVGS